MRAYADTSFLYALQLRDSNSAAAIDYLRAHRRALPFTPLHRCELKNAVRMAVFRKSADPAAAQAALKQIELDVAAGDWVETPLVWPELLDQAEQLGGIHTSALGVRTLDLIHLGAAASLGLREFLTFDTRQRACAKAAGFRVGP
jgi:predicted nucleic acid-binding protein